MKNYRILKTLDLDGRRYFRETDAQLEIPENLENDLITQHVIRVIDEKPVEDAKGKKAAG